MVDVYGLFESQKWIGAEELGRVPVVDRHADSTPLGTLRSINKTVPFYVNQPSVCIQQSALSLTLSDLPVV